MSIGFIIIMIKQFFATANSKHFLISIEDDNFSQTEVFDEFVKFKNDKEFQSANQIVKTNGKFMLSIIKA
jgi:hypothetical protein